MRFLNTAATSWSREAVPLFITPRFLAIIAKS
jgi:hypothetical protein